MELSLQITKQKARNYYNLVFGEETSRYIPRIVAFKEIFKDPQSFGFFLEEEDLYPQLKYTMVKINSTIPDWANFAALNGINYKTLKYYNPWLRDNQLSNKKLKSYEIKIPVKESIELIKE